MVTGQLQLPAVHVSCHVSIFTCCLVQRVHSNRPVAAIGMCVGRHVVLGVAGTVTVIVVHCTELVEVCLIVGDVLKEPSGTIPGSLCTQQLYVIVVYIQE